MTPTPHRRLAILAGFALATAVALPAIASGPAQVAAADTIVVKASADAHVKSKYPRKNLGSTSVLRARAGGGNKHRSFLSFRVPAFSGTVESVALRVFVTEPSRKGGTVHRVTGAWSEKKVTWATAPAYRSTPLAVASATPAAGSWFEIDLPANAVKSGGRLDLAIVGATTDAVKYKSRETKRAPRLVVAVGEAADPAPAPKVAVGDGILVSRSHLASLPTSGSAWKNLKSSADGSTGTPDLQDQDSNTDIAILAKALVFARTGDASYRTSVVAALKAVVGTETGGRTLALGRNLPGYVIAADLIGLSSVASSFDGNTFRPWLRGLLTKNLDGMTLRSTHEDRPNNWGTHAGAARAAIAAYLGDNVEMARTARVFKGWLGDRSAYAGFRFQYDLTWHCDEAKPVGINPAGCTRNGIVIDGALPDDMRRGGSFQWPPAETGYAWEAMQGALLQALLLDRAGYDAFAWENKAIRRAADFLYDRVGWVPEGDDTWQPWVLNHAYGTNRPASSPARAGKNIGFTDWLFAN